MLSPNNLKDVIEKEKDRSDRMKGNPVKSDVMRKENVQDLQDAVTMTKDTRKDPTAGKSTQNQANTTVNDLARKKSAATVKNMTSMKKEAIEGTKSL